MSMLTFAVVSAGLLGAVVARPNVVVFMPDDMPFLWPEAPISQTNFGLTANFDSIRTNGVVFTQAYTAGVMCAPARFAVLTGRYCSRSEAAQAASNSNNPRVAISVPNCKIDGGDYSKTIPFFMSAAGYQTIFSGKWHLSRGQSAALFADYASVWDDVQASGFTVDGGIYASNMNTLAPGTVDFSHNVEWNVALSRAAIQQAVADGDEFFLYFAPTVPHDSVGASLAITDGILKTPNGTLTTVPVSGMPTRANILATYGNLRDSLLGTVLSDLALGAILTELSLHAGVADNTLVIALMDHGVLDKQEITEGGTRIAMMAQYTGMGGLPRGATVSAQVTNLDLASTIFAAAGVSATYANDGASWFATAQGSTPSGRYTISENGQDRAVVSPAGMKLVSRIDAAGASTTALYDLALDPTEITDRSTDSTYTTVLSELAAVMQCHDSNTGWTPVADPQPNCHSTSPTTAAPVTAAPTMPACVSTTIALSSTDYTAMYTVLATALGPDSGVGPRDQRGDFVGAAVRLTFHDAAEIDITSTADNLGVDGCVDFTQSGNNGLSEVVGQLETLRTPYCHLISRADWWVLAGKVAVELRATVNGYTVPFRYGRTDATDCSNAAGRLPSAENGVEEINRVFVTQMGLDFRDAAALLGAHTLGRTQTANSGYNGPWVPDSGVFDNDYYTELLRVWDKTNVDLTHTEWRRGTGNGVRIMLNADMELAYNVVDELAQLSLCGGRPTNDPVRCTENTAVSSHAREFALDNTVWLTQFSASYKLMTEVGYTDGDLDCVLDTNGLPIGGVTGAECTSTGPNSPTTAAPTTAVPTTAAPTTAVPTTAAPTTAVPTTAAPTTAVPTTSAPTTAAPTTAAPTTATPTTVAPTTAVPTTTAPVTSSPITSPTTVCCPDGSATIGVGRRQCRHSTVRGRPGPQHCI